MTLIKLRLIRPLVLGCVPIVLGTLCLVASPVLAQKIPNYCRKGESTFLNMETKSYWVSICGGDNPNSYVGVSKKDRRQNVRVPLKDFDPKGTYFDAVNKDVEYILAKTPKGNFLTVTKGRRELLREPVLRGW